MNRFYDYRVLECPAEKQFQLEEFLSDLVHDKSISVESVLQHVNAEYPETGITILFLGNTDFVLLTGYNMKFIEEPIESTGKAIFQL